MKNTTKGFKRIRLELNHQIEKALDDLKWDRAKLAERYGVHVLGRTYSRSTMTQLVNVWKGREEDSEKMLNWMIEQIKGEL